MIPVLLALLPCAATNCESAEDKYVEDWEFLADTIAREAAALEVRDIDWKAERARLEPLFEACTDDVTHVENVMRALALLRDSHSGVTRYSLPEGAALPSKWDGLYGGGLWFAWEDGRVMLRGVMEGHSLEGTVAPGQALLEVDGLPAWLALERERRRITTYQGASTDHSLFSSMSNRLLPFGDAREVECVFLDADSGRTRKTMVPRWGPGGRAFSPSSATLPEGVEWREGALARVLELEWCERVGYLRITGGMDAETVRAFHAAFDELRGVEAILLDCRGMGGGGDGSAWEMAGRFFPDGVDNGLHGRIEPSGDWQFDGPVVMLQDESEVSSAETFTWALSETERCVSVGRPTGGSSGLASFRLGVNARPTPIERVQTEGVGWPPDVLVPHGPGFCAEDDPVRSIGLEVLLALHAGNKRDDVEESFAALFTGDLKGWARSAKSLAKRAKAWNPRDLAERVEADLALTLELELLLLDGDDVALPDVRGAEHRLETLAARAKAAGMSGALKKLQKAVKALAKEGAAQDALLALLDENFEASEEARESFLSKHGRTATGRFAAERLWSGD
jgi:hypothetical protein